VLSSGKSTERPLRKRRTITAITVAKERPTRRRSTSG
jgi:hypothetical protein